MGWWGDFLARLFGAGPSRSRQRSSDASRHSSLAPYLVPPRATEYPQHPQAPTHVSPQYSALPPAVGGASVLPPPLAIPLAPVAPPAPLAQPPAAPAEYTYALRDDFLSRAEASFFHVLRAAVAAGSLIFPKVRLADLVFPPRQEGQFGAWQRINRKHVDLSSASRAPCARSSRSNSMIARIAAPTASNAMLSWTASSPMRGCRSSMSPRAAATIRGRSPR